jgi:hypothetical protein
MPRFCRYGRRRADALWMARQSARQRGMAEKRPLIRKVLENTEY